MPGPTRAGHFVAPNGLVTKSRPPRLLLVKASASAGILEANEWTAQTGTGRVRAWRDVSDDGSGYARARRQPQGLVVFSHGHGASPYDWFAQMQRVAQNDGVIALAMYYPGETGTDPSPKTTYGWRAREGAQAGIAGAMAFLQTCPKLQLRTIVNYGSAWATTPPA
jgi:hypothetical protein